MSERAQALEVPNERDALEFAARVLRSRADRVPVGAEDQTKGASVFNWLTWAVLLLREEAQASAAPPVGVSPQPERFVDPEPECPGPECSRCSGEYCDVHITDPCDCDVAERHANDIGKPASLSPVEPTPLTEQFMVDALAAAVADRDHSDAQLAAIEAVVRQELCPIENSESQGDDEPEPRYICMSEDGDRIIEADDIPGVIRQVVARWDAAGKRCEAAKAALETIKSAPVEPTPSREPLTGAELLDRFRPVEPTPEPPAPSGGRPTTTIEKVAREIARHLMTNTLGERCDRLAQLYQGFPIGGGWSLDGAAELIAEVLENEGYIMDRVAEAQRRSTPVEPAPRQEGV